MRSALFSAVALAWLGLSAHALDGPPNYDHFFKVRTDNRPLLNKMLNLVHLKRDNINKSFAFIVGISTYPKMHSPDGDLKPAREDVRKMVNYLRDVEKFDEIVVLEDQDVNLGNLDHFLDKYFPDQLKLNPRSRFLFVYSGHGTTTVAPNGEQSGYILTADATQLNDTANNIPMHVLRSMMTGVIDSGFDVLVLINACYSGEFLARTSGSARYVPTDPGAHAIMAGGPNELTWHTSSVGTGSVFFEKILAALGGRAGSGSIITEPELVAYLAREVPLATNNAQHPLPGTSVGTGVSEASTFLTVSLLFRPA